eukprot:gene2330-3610_t
MVKPTPMVAANWKCNGTKASVDELLQSFAQAKAGHPVECVVAPPLLHIPATQAALKGNALWAVAAQNCIAADGAFTGEVSAPMLKDFGVPWVILGHSERRSLYGESNGIVAAKVKAALAAGLKVIVCVGESLEQREQDKTMEVVLAQMAAVVEILPDGSWPSVVLAYEPVWAIGTGKVATPEQAQVVHAGMRTWLAEKTSPEIAAAARILYGGSVKSGNAASLYEQPDINGFLVGGASLTPDFLAIIAAAK